MENLVWHSYVTRNRHVVCGYGSLPGLKVIPAGTQCLATRLPDYRLVLTFEDLSTILSEEWHLEGIEEPGLLHPKWMRDIHAIEDALFTKAIGEAIEQLEQEKANG